MNPALLLATQLLFAQTDPSTTTDVTLDGEAQAQTNAEAVEELQARLSEIEARLAELEAQTAGSTDSQAEIAALREEAVALQELAVAPIEAAALQRQTLQLRQVAVQNGLDAVREAYRVIDTGEADVSGSVARAYSAFEEAWLLATEAGSPAEAQQFQEAMRLLSAVAPALEERNYSAAKALLDQSAVSGLEGLQLARSTATLPVNATQP